MELKIFTKKSLILHQLIFRIIYTIYHFIYGDYSVIYKVSYSENNSFSYFLLRID